MITAFYHVGGINHWREIVSEQLRLLGHAGFPGVVHVHYGGPEDEQWFIMRVAEAHGLTISFLPNQPGRCESPALEALEAYAYESMCPNETLLYFHTKGGGTPNSWRHVMWRWMMNAYVLVQWQKAEETLVEEALDWVAPQVIGWPVVHPAGNMWMARAGYIRTLMDFRDYHRTFFERHRGMFPHWIEQRHADEFWLGSGTDSRHRSIMTHEVELSNHMSWCEHVEAQEYATERGS